MYLSRPALFSLGFATALVVVSAGALRAQTPTPRTPPVPTMRSVSFDFAGLDRERYRAGVEAVAFGRLTVGFSVAYSNRPDREGQPGPVPLRGYDPDDRNVCVESSSGPRCVPSGLPNDPMPCYESFSGPGCVSPWPYDGDEHYRAWSADLALRYYPSILSFENGPSRMMVYVGEFVSYHWRTWDEQVVYYYDGTRGPYMAPQDTVIEPPRPDSVPIIIRPPYPYPIVPGPNPIRHSLHGFEPGVEVGVRLLPLGKLFVEVGGRFTLVTIEDPRRRTRPGDVESRLTIAAGFGW